MTRITNDELERFRLNFSKYANGDGAPLNKLKFGNFRKKKIHTEVCAVC